jgi:hypothetical protein
MRLTYRSPWHLESNRSRSSRFSRRRSLISLRYPTRSSSRQPRRKRHLGAMQESECERSRQKIARALAESNTGMNAGFFRAESNKSQLKLARKVQRCDRSAGVFLLSHLVNVLNQCTCPAAAQRQRFPASERHAFKNMVQTPKATAGCLAEEVRAAYPNPNPDRELHA